MIHEAKKVYESLQQVWYTKLKVLRTYENELKRKVIKCKQMKQLVSLYYVKICTLKVHRHLNYVFLERMLQSILDAYKVALTDYKTWKRYVDCLQSGMRTAQEMDVPPIVIQWLKRDTFSVHRVPQQPYISDEDWDAQQMGDPLLMDEDEQAPKDRSSVFMRKRVPAFMAIKYAFDQQEYLVTPEPELLRQLAVELTKYDIFMQRMHSQSKSGEMVEHILHTWKRYLYARYGSLDKWVCKNISVLLT